MPAPVLRVTRFVLAMLAELPALAAAQLAPGARVRVRLDTAVIVPGTNTTRSPNVSYVGELVLQAGDSLWLRIAGDSVVTIARQRISALDLSTGQHSSALGGAVAGGLLGAGVGLLAGQLNSCSNTSASFICSSGSDMVRIAVGTALLGATIGAIVGSPKRERWTRVTDLLVVRPGIRRGHESVGVELALRW